MNEPLSFTCPKCGWAEIEMRWHPDMAGGFGLAAVSEGFDLTCKRCLYEWRRDLRTGREEQTIHGTGKVFVVGKDLRMESVR